MDKVANTVGVAFEAITGIVDFPVKPFIIGEDKEVSEADRTPLNAKEKAKLSECIKIIDDNITAVWEVGKSLYEIKSGRLYRETHSSFKLFCEETLHISRSHAFRLTAEHEVMQNFKGASPKDAAIPKGAGQTRVVSGLPKDDQLKVGQRVKANVGDKPATAQDYKQAKDQLADEGEIEVAEESTKAAKPKLPAKRAQIAKTPDAVKSLLRKKGLPSFQEMMQAASDVYAAIEDMPLEEGKKRQMEKLVKQLKAWAVVQEEEGRN